jgi:hypothetical protein
MKMQDFVQILLLLKNCAKYACIRNWNRNQNLCWLDIWNKAMKTILLFNTINLCYMYYQECEKLYFT